MSAPASWPERERGMKEMPIESIKIRETMILDDFLGLGDTLHIRSLARAMSHKYDLYVRTATPCLFWDVPDLKFLKPNTDLRAQAAHIETYPAETWSQIPETPDRQARLEIDAKAIAAGASIPAMFAAKTGRNYEFRLPIPPAWEKTIRTLLDEINPEGKKICVVSPPTLRTEWPCPSQNPIPYYLQAIIDAYADEYHFISVANLEDGAETLVEDLGGIDTEFNHGELGLTDLCALVSLSDMLLCGPCDLMMIGIATQTKTFAVYGGYIRPSAIVDEAMGLDLYSDAAPEPFCHCLLPDHECEKEIDQKQLMARFEALRRKPALGCELWDGMWKGRRCFVVGNGPSVDGFDFDRLKGELVIAVNNAFTRCDPAITFTMDTRFFALLSAGQFGDDVRGRYEKFPGIKAVLKTSNTYRYPADVCLLNGHRSQKLKHQMTTALSHGLGHGECSGFAALNLALNLGADPIHLVGFDMRDDEIATAKRGAGLVDQYPQRRAHFEASAAEALSRSKIYNLNPESGLRCFPFRDLADMQWPEHPMFVSHYTKGTGYEIEARELVKTLTRWGLEYDVEGDVSHGSWVANCNQKIHYIARMRRKHAGRRLVWLDADARVRKHPSLFEGLKCDFAAHFLNGGRARIGQRRTPLAELWPPDENQPWTQGELLAGTMYFAPSWQAERIIDQWIARTQDHPEEWDQENLQRALPKCQGANIGTLPAEYCSIFNHPARGAEPVIEQLQASRRLKQEINRNAKEFQK